MKDRETRRLGSFERAETLTGEHFAFNVVVVLCLSGALDPERVRRALDALQERHALLRARIAGRGRRRRFELATVRELPLRVLERTTDQTWQGVVEDELSTRIEVAAGPLARAVLVSGEAGGGREIVLTLHHAIVDATSVRHLAQELLTLCAGGEPGQAAVQTIPPSADDLFPPAYRAPRRWLASAAFLARQAADELSYTWRSRKRRHYSPGGAGRCRIHCLALDAAESTALERATRRQRVGVFSALAAAMLLAVVNRCYGNQAGPQRYFAFPLLRPYLSPPVAPEVVAGYLTTLRLTVDVDPAEGLWPLAARMHAQVDRSAKRGERYLASVWSAASMRVLLGQRRRMAATALNYAGATRLQLESAAPFVLEELHAFVSDFLPGPEYTGQARIFNGRLWWDLVYLDVDLSREQAGAIADAMRERLLEAIRQVAGVAA